MEDFYFNMRQQMIERMQSSLKQVRQALGFGVQEFGDVIGLTRQTINNLENKKNKMSATQYVAICALIDNCTKDNPDKLAILTMILSESEEGLHSLEPGEMPIHVINDVEPFLKRWFKCFPDESKVIGFERHEDDWFFSEDDLYKSLAERYKIFFDDSALCSEGIEPILDGLKSHMQENRNQYIVPMKVAESIQHTIVNADPDDMQTAQRGLKNLLRLQQDELIKIRGEKTDYNIISTFLTVFAKFKCANRLAIITQDESLAQQILALNSDDIGGFTIMAYKCGEGKLERWDISLMNRELDKLFDLEKINNSFTGWETID